MLPIKQPINHISPDRMLKFVARNRRPVVAGPASTTRWNSNLNNHQGGYQFFHAWADGSQGWSPFNWVPGISVSAASPSDPPSLKNVTPAEAARRKAMVAEFGRSGFGDEDVELTSSPDPQNSSQKDPCDTSDLAIPAGVDVNKNIAEAIKNAEDAIKPKSKLYC